MRKSNFWKSRFFSVFCQDFILKKTRLSQRNLISYQGSQRTMELQHNNLSGKHYLKVHEETQIMYFYLILDVTVVSTRVKTKVNWIQFMYDSCIDDILRKVTINKGPSLKHKNLTIYQTKMYSEMHIAE